MLIVEKHTSTETPGNPVEKLREHVDKGRDLYVKISRNPKLIKRGEEWLEQWQTLAEATGESADKLQELSGDTRDQIHAIVSVLKRDTESQNSSKNKKKPDNSRFFDQDEIVEGQTSQISENHKTTFELPLEFQFDFEEVRRIAILIAEAEAKNYIANEDRNLLKLQLKAERDLAEAESKTGEIAEIDALLERLAKISDLLVLSDADLLEPTTSSLNKKSTLHGPDEAALLVSDARHMADRIKKSDPDDLVNIVLHEVGDLINKIDAQASGSLPDAVFEELQEYRKVIDEYYKQRLSAEDMSLELPEDEFSQKEDREEQAEKEYLPADFVKFMTETKSYITRINGHPELWNAGTAASCAQRNLRLREAFSALPTAALRSQVGDFYTDSWKWFTEMQHLIVKPACKKFQEDVAWIAKFSVLDRNNGLDEKTLAEAQNHMKSMKASLHEVADMLAENEVLATTQMAATPAVMAATAYATRWEKIMNDTLRDMAQKEVPRFEKILKDAFDYLEKAEQSQILTYKQEIVDELLKYEERCSAQRMRMRTIRLAGYPMEYPDNLSKNYKNLLERIRKYSQNSSVHTNNEKFSSKKNTHLYAAPKWSGSANHKVSHEAKRWIARLHGKQSHAADKPKSA